MTNMDYKFYRLTKEHYPDLCRISLSAFGFDPGIEYYEKKNATDYLNHSNLGYIAYAEDGEPAAFYGVYAYPVILDGVKIVAVQSGDTMTHKNHTGKGLFTTLAKLTYELAKNEGVDFVFGFPNYNSYPGFVKKLNWICPETLVEYRAKVTTIPLMKLAKKVKLFNPLYRLHYRLVLKLFAKQAELGFNASPIDKDVGSVDRVEEYLKYKSVSGCEFIELNDCKIWVKPDGFFMIGDFERSENLNYQSTWNKLKRLAVILGADVVVFQCMKNTFLDNKFSEFLSRSEALPFGYLNLSERVDPAKFKFVLGDVDTF